MTWQDRLQPLLHPDCMGIGSIQILAQEPWYDEEDLPFTIHGAGILRLEPVPGFTPESLAGSPDEARVIAPCPDAPGWLVPEDIVAGFLGRTITVPDLEDLLLSHPLYQEDDGEPTPGHGLLQWLPGVPELVSIHSPILGDDPSLPAANRDKEAYLAGLAEILDAIEGLADPLEISIAFRYWASPAERPTT